MQNILFQNYCLMGKNCNFKNVIFLNDKPHLKNSFWCFLDKSFHSRLNKISPKIIIFKNGTNAYQNITNIPFHNLVLEVFNCKSLNLIIWHRETYRFSQVKR